MNLIQMTIISTIVGKNPLEEMESRNPVHFNSLDFKNADVHSWHLVVDHIQFTFIQGPNIPGSCAILFFTASDFISITSHVHNWVVFFLGSISSFFLELFFHSSPVVY